MIQSIVSVWDMRTDRNIRELMAQLKDIVSVWDMRFNYALKIDFY